MSLLLLLHIYPDKDPSFNSSLPVKAEGQSITLLCTTAIRYLLQLRAWSGHDGVASGIRRCGSGEVLDRVTITYRGGIALVG